MKTILRSTMVLFFLAAAAPGLSMDKKVTRLEKLEFQSQEYSLIADCSLGRADIILKGRTSANLSAGMEGENIPLATRICGDNFYVFWLNYKDASVRLAFYDFRRDRSRILDLRGFSFIAVPEVIEADDGRLALLFLGNRSDNDDIFYCEPDNGLLTPLTATPFSEKGFTFQENNGRLEIATRSLWAQYRYTFDLTRRECVMVEKINRPARQKKITGVKTPEYYNTFVGFGDSITWGKFEGEQHLEICYLTQMKALMADPGDDNYYGSSTSVNLGVPGDTTLDGAERVDQELEDYSGFYFLLMLGVNDAINNSLSIDSSLENLEYIIDAAAERGMRIIVSTLTPSKSFFSQYEYYWENLRGLRTGILALAHDKNVACVDTLNAFMDTNPPNGWKNLLENIIENVSSGNHPNAAGHRIIADLFANALVAFPPLPPTGVSVRNPVDTLKKNVQWDANYESDFSHFAIEFAFSATNLSHQLTTNENHFTFTLFPFLPQLYFRLQAVDYNSNASAFTAVFPAQAGKNGGK
jgi:lysophospholipase L1-like esterase